MDEKNVLGMSFFYFVARIGCYCPKEIFVKIIGREHIFFVLKGNQKKVLSKKEGVGIFTCLSDDTYNPNFLSRIADVIIAPDKILFIWSNNPDDCWVIEKNDNDRETFESLEVAFR